jgi:hypoxanthine phosphoribosyltransferase
MNLMSHDNPEVVGVPPYRFRRLIPASAIHDALCVIAARLRADYDGKRPILIGVLNGCFVFMADLIREMNISCEVDFIKISSYEDAMSPSTVRLVKDVSANITGRHVILVEDIVDTGKSLEFLRTHLQANNPASLVMAAMFNKDCPKMAGAYAEYVAMDIPNKFVVGYGLDYAQEWRHLPDLHALVEN